MRWHKHAVRYSQSHLAHSLQPSAHHPNDAYNFPMHASQPSERASFFEYHTLGGNSGVSEQVAFELMHSYKMKKVGKTTNTHTHMHIQILQLLGNMLQLIKLNSSI